MIIVNNPVTVANASVTAPKLSGAQTGTAPIFGVRAWANFDGTTGAIRASGNISSIVRNSTGDYTINFTTAMPDANYAISALAGGTANNSVVRTYEDLTARTSSLFRIVVFSSPGLGAVDSAQVNIMVLR